MSRPPNILFLFSDQQRWDTMGCYGQALPVTPHLDAMARSGTIVNNAFTCQPVCGPARAALQTGRWPTELGCFTNHRMLPTDTATIAKILRGAGYETGYLGKWHLASCGPENGPDNFRTKPVPPERRGGYEDFWLAADALEFTSHGWDGHMFDGNGQRRDFPPGAYRVDAQTDWLIEYLRSRDGKRPFFMFCSYLEPHHQNDHDTHEGPVGSKERFADFTVPGDLYGTGGNWRTDYPDYLGACASLDANVGRIRATLRELGMEDNTLVIYTSDHGSHFRTRNGEYKRSCHDACIRIPMLIHGPGWRGGQAIDGLASLIDLPPTLLTAAGVTPPSWMRGRPLQRALAGDPAWNDEVYLQISESQVGRAIRTRRWTYAVQAPGAKPWEDPASSHYVESHLYDLATDPHQRHDLVRDPAYAAVRAQLRERLAVRMAEAGEAPATIAPAP